MSSTDQFNILGSSKLNTADGKNPAPVSDASIPAESRGNAVGQTGTTTTAAGESKSQFNKSAHDVLEDRLREEERLART